MLSIYSKAQQEDSFYTAEKLGFRALVSRWLVSSCIQACIEKVVGYARTQKYLQSQVGGIMVNVYEYLCFAEFSSFYNE